MNKILFYFLFYLTALGTLNAQNNEVIKIDNLTSLWKLAIENNPTQKVYALKKQQTIDDRKTAESYKYPQATIGINGQDNLIQSVTPVPGIIFNKPGTVYLQFGKHYTYNSGLTITKDLFTWQSKWQEKIAKENIALNTVQQEAFIQTLKTQIGQYYYVLLVAKSSIKIAERDILVADSAFQTAKQKFKEGLTDASFVNQANINKNNVSQNLETSQLLYNQAMANLKILSGVSANTIFAFKENSIDNESNQINEEYSGLGTDKTLIPYSLNITIAEMQCKAQIAATYPKFVATGYFGFQQFQDNFKLGFEKNSWTDYQYIGLGLNWPIFTGFANSNKLKSITTQKQIAETNLKAATFQSAVNDSLLIQNYQTYQRMTITSKNSFELYGKNLGLSMLKFKEGLVSIDNYLKIFQDYLTAENTYLNNLTNYLSTKVAIEARASTP